MGRRNRPVRRLYRLAAGGRRAGQPLGGQFEGSPQQDRGGVGVLRERFAASCHSRESGNPVHHPGKLFWMPAFASMTKWQRRRTSVESAAPRELLETQ